MKKRGLNRLLRVITFLLAVIMGTLAVFGCIAATICYTTGMYGDASKQEVLSQVYSRLQEHYEMKVMEEIDNKDFDKLKDTNLTYHLYKKEINTDEKDLPDGHVYSVGDSMIYRNADGILWNLLFRNSVAEHDDFTTIEYFVINSLVYNTKDKIFYYRTDNGYFPIQEISVETKYAQLKGGGIATGSSYLDYSLANNKQSYVCEDDNYQPLNTSAYAQWTSALFDGMELYTPCIVTQAITKNPFQQTVEDNAYSLELTYDGDDYDDDCLLYIGDTDAFSSQDQNISTHNGIKTLVQIEPEISTEVEPERPDQYIISSKIASPLDMSKPDLFVHCTNVISALYPNRLLILYGTIIACGLFLVFVIICCRCTLRMKPDNENEQDYPGLFARIPLLLYLLVMGSLLYACICICPYIFNAWIENTRSVINMDLTLLIEVLLIGFFTGMHMLTNLCERIRTKTLRRYTICHYFIKPFRKIWGKLQAHRMQLRDFVAAHTTLLFRTGVIWIALSVLQLFVMCMTQYDIGAEIILFTLYKLLEAACILIAISQFSQIVKGGRQLCEGDLSQKLDTSKLFGPFRKHAEQLNQIGDGIQIAVQERLKSERFKTELITNVTHDIKTPLTSIINYVDLMQKEGITEAETDEYLDVLDRQSARLKKLIEDLIEASKASTGNVSVIFEPCDLEILLTQTLGEFEEKLLANHLELIIRNTTKQKSAAAGDDPDVINNEAIIICADNRHLWRIFDNLMNNICKYAQPHTRVYIDLEEEEGAANIVFRNTSRYPLDIDGDALLERFVRGDTSRNTEGNGLGLSIAKSLTDLMGGTMKLHVDGDLFKVIITFPLKKVNHGEQGK